MLLSSRQLKAIRYAEMGIVVVLLFFALLTYRELSALRKFPVVLPTYQFESTGGADPAGFVVTRGTWTADSGKPEPLATITIECRYASMQCIESAATVVFMDGKGLLEAKSTQFDVDHWNDKEIVAKPLNDRCFSRTLRLELAEKRALSHISPNTGETNCRVERDRNLELVAGYRMRPG